MVILTALGEQTYQAISVSRVQCHLTRVGGPGEKVVKIEQFGMISVWYGFLPKENPPTKVTENMPKRTAKNFKRRVNGLAEEALLEWHRLHVGVYRRIAQSLGVDPSYVSRVANGKRNAPEIKTALLGELARIRKVLPRTDA